MLRSMLKLLGAGALISATYVQPVHADPPSCQESAEYCVDTYSGCPAIGGWPPAVQMFCMTDCSDEAYTMYSEYCTL